MDSQTAESSLAAVRTVPPQPEAFPDVPSNPALQPEDWPAVLGPEKTSKPPAKIDTGYHKADVAIQRLIDLLAA